MLKIWQFYKFSLLVMVVLIIPRLYEGIHFVITQMLEEDSVETQRYMSMPLELIILEVLFWLFSLIACLGLLFNKHWSWYLFHVLAIPIVIALPLFEIIRFIKYDQLFIVYSLVPFVLILHVLCGLFFQRAVNGFSDLYQSKDYRLTLLGMIVFLLSFITYILLSS